MNNIIKEERGEKVCRGRGIARRRGSVLEGNSIAEELRGLIIRLPKSVVMRFNIEARRAKLSPCYLKLFEEEDMFGKLCGGMFVLRITM